MTYRECVGLFKMLDTAYGVKRGPGDVQPIRFYAVFLQPYASDAVWNAALAHIKQSPYFPRISDLVEKLDTEGLRDVDEAWQEVLQQIQTVGRYGRPTWSNPAIGEAVAALGWDGLCGSSNPAADRARFVQFYGRVRSRTQVKRAAEQTVKSMASLGFDVRSIGQGGDP